MRLFRTSIDLLKGTIGLMLLAGIVVNFANVLMRYVFGSPFPWTEEVLIFGLVFIVMAGTVVATALDSNLKIDVVQHILPSLGQRLLRVFSHLIWLGVSIFLAMQSYTVLTLMMRLGQTSMVTRLPTWIPHSVLFASFLLSACAAVYAIIREFAAVPVEHQTPGTDTAAVAETHRDPGHGL